MRFGFRLSCLGKQKFTRANHTRRNQAQLSTISPDGKGLVLCGLLTACHYQVPADLPSGDLVLPDVVLEEDGARRQLRYESENNASEDGTGHFTELL